LANWNLFNLRNLVNLDHFLYLKSFVPEGTPWLKSRGNTGPFDLEVDGKGIGARIRDVVYHGYCPSTGVYEAVGPCRGGYGT